MNHFVAGILRIVILEATAATILVDRLWSPRRVRWVYAALAALSVLAFLNFGQLRGSGPMIHQWEQFHFYLGSKYLPEIGYFDLYKAAALADRESVHILGAVDKTRDLHTFEVEPLEPALARDGARIRARFTDQRWEAFKRDWAALTSRPAPWANVLTDHGNSASPAWAILAYPIASVMPLGTAPQQVMGLLDFLLMGILFHTLFRTFGWKPGCVALGVWSMLPFCFDYLAGSFLRWDWLFAVGMCVCFLKRGRPLGAGAFLGYAVASKIFPLYFGVAWAMRVAWGSWRARRIDRAHVRFAGGALAALALSVGISSVMLGRAGLWREYLERIEVARVEKYYPNQYSLRTVYLQAAETPALEFVAGWAAPSEIKQGLRNLDIHQHRFGFLIVQLALSALLLFALRDAEEWVAFAMGPLLVYTWLVVNAYYWNMLALPALAWFARSPPTRPSLAALVALDATLMAFYLYQHLRFGYAEGYFVAALLFLLFAGWAVLEIVEQRRRSRKPGEVQPTEQVARQEPLPARAEAR